MLFPSSLEKQNMLVGLSFYIFAASGGYLYFVSINKENLGISISSTSVKLQLVLAVERDWRDSDTKTPINWCAVRSAELGDIENWN